MSKYKQLFKFIKIIFFLNIIGFMFGLIQILINDNNIQNMNGMFSDFIGVNYNFILLPLLLIVSFIYINTWESEKLNNIENYMIAILIAIVVSMVVSLVTGNFGWYGGVSTLLVSNVDRYIPFMLLLPFYNKNRISKVAFIFGLAGAVLTLFYNATGKMIILYMLVPFAVIAILWKKKKYIPVLLTVCIIPIGIIVAVKMVDIVLNNSLLFQIKLDQALSVLKVWQPNWLINMPDSPRARIVEFINIFYEYAQKPWFFIFGKGYMGTIKDHIGMIGTTYIEGSYSINQWDNSAFYAVHETLNLIFLYHGLVGVLFYVYMIKSVLSNFTKNPWILIGGFWFLMIYGFSVTMSAYGITALVIGYMQLDNRYDMKNRAN